MGFLLPGFIQLGDPKTPRDVLIAQLVQYISLSSAPESMMNEETINQAANHAMEVIEGIYGGENCPFKPEDAEYSRHCYLKSMADQWFMGGFLRAEENCETRLRGHQKHVTKLQQLAYTVGPTDSQASFGSAKVFS